MSSFGSRDLSEAGSRPGAVGTGAGEGPGFTGSTFAVVCADGVLFAFGAVFAEGATVTVAAPASAGGLTGSAFAIAAAVFSRADGAGAVAWGAWLAAASLCFGHATNVAITASVTKAVATRKRFFAREGAVVVAVAIGVV